MARTRRDEPLVPRFAVRLNDRPLANDLALWIVSVVVEDELDGPSMFSLELISKEDERSSTAWTDDPRLALGATVELRMGYGDDLESLIIGDITALEPTFSTGGPPTLVVRGYDRRHRLNGVRRRKVFPKVKDSAVAAQLCEGLMSIESTDSSVVNEHLFQADQTDLEFLTQRAHRIGYELVMKGTTLQFRPIANRAPAVATLTLHDDLLEFRPRMSLEKVTELRAVSWDPKQKKSLSASASAESNPGMDGKQPGSRKAAAVFGHATETLVRTPMASQAEANQLVVGHFNTAALKFVTGDGIARGRTDVRAGRVIRLEGLGDLFSGSYYVRSAVHRYSARAGYLTDFHVERNAS